MKKAEFDKELYEALSRLNQKKMDELPSMEELENANHAHQFSEKFEREMQQLIQTQQNQYIPNTNYKIKKSGVLLAGIVIVLTIGITAGASRTGLTRFAVGIHKDHSEVNYEIPNMELAPKEILEHREPEWGEEYEEVERNEDKLSIKVRMSKKDSDLQIKFTQMVLSVGESYLNTEYTNMDKVLLELKSGKTAYSIIDSDIQFLFWNDGEYYYRLQGNCEVEELLRLANSIKVS